MFSPKSRRGRLDLFSSAKAASRSPRDTQRSERRSDASSTRIAWRRAPS